MGNEKTNVVEAMELNVLIDGAYNELREHLKEGQTKLFNVQTMYFGDTGEQSEEITCPNTKMEMLKKAFRDMHQFISDTEAFLDLL